MKLSRALVVASLLAGVGVLTACPTTTQTTSVPVPAKGTVITQELYSKFLPTPKLGQKWTYAVSFTSPETDPDRAEMTLEVTGIDGDVVTTTQTTLNEGSTTPITATSTSSISKPLHQNENMNITSGGAEDVTVPFKAYTGAAKVIGTEDGKTAFTVWLVPGVGLVKLSSGDAESGLYVQELKDFKQP